MRVGIMCPMEAEVAQVAKQLADVHCLSLAGMRIQQGEWRGLSCVVVKSGLGKVAAAAGTQVLISTCQADVVFVVGLAGALDPALQIGDVIVGDRLIQHDLDARPLFDYSLIPDLGVKWIETDSTLRILSVDALRERVLPSFQKWFSSEIRTRFGMSQPTVKVGTILTGDQFIAKKKIHALKQTFPEALCVEMEGAAIGQVCYMNRVPVSVVRIISDRADETASIDFTQFLTDVSSFYIFAILDAILSLVSERLPQLPRPAPPTSTPRA